MRLVALTLAAVGALSVSANAHAADPRIAVSSIEGRGALALRLGAELTELGYVVVPLTPDEAKDGAATSAALERTHALGALLVEPAPGGGVEACILQEQSPRACTSIAGATERVDDAQIATRAVELLRVSIVEEKAVSPHPLPPVSGPKTSEDTVTTAAEAPVYASDDEEATGHTLEGRVGPGVVLANGMPAEFAAGIGFDWIADPHLAIGVEAMIPVSTSSIERAEGTVSARATSADIHVDGRFAAGRWETALGLGLGAMWLQVNGAAPAPLQGQDDSLLDPFATIHAELGVFLNDSLAIRTDVSGGYVLSRATIRFAGKDVTDVGRPLAGSTISLAFAWP